MSGSRKADGGDPCYQRRDDPRLGIIAEPRRTRSRNVPDEPGRTTVFLCGSGHSGSTLLDMLLGGHTQVSSLGEAIFLHFNVRNRTPADLCTCGRHVTDCPFWHAVEVASAALLAVHDGLPVLPRLPVADPRMADLRDQRGDFVKRKADERYQFRSRMHEASMLVGSRRLRRVLASASSEVELHRAVAMNLNFLYDAVRKGNGTPVVVDSTKNPGYAKGVYLEQTAPMRFVLVLRDGRAVSYSRMRREGVSMRVAAKLWRREHLKRIAAHATVPSQQRLTVHYEALCRDSETELTRLTTWLGLEYEPSMLNFREDRHNLGGNPMRHRRPEGQIVLEEDWRTELSPTDLADFYAVAGRLNRRLGYGR